MRIENAIGAEVLERMLSAYGYSMQKELAEHLGIAKSNVAGWVQRGQVPGNAIIQCVLDTGADLKWLITGKLEKASFPYPEPIVIGKTHYEEVIANGGKPVLRRILDAYGFTMQKQLCDLLGISSGTVSTWLRRNYFPGDIVVTCALDTNVSLKWLATGRGELSRQETALQNNMMPKKILSAGILENAGDWSCELSFLPRKPIAPIFISSNEGCWVIDTALASISNGLWLLGVDEKYDIYEVALLPGRKIKVNNKFSSFICEIDEVKVSGKVYLSMDYKF